jgi:hypothetical protein
LATFPFEAQGVLVDANAMGDLGESAIKNLHLAEYKIFHHNYIPVLSVAVICSNNAICCLSLSGTFPGGCRVSSIRRFLSLRSEAAASYDNAL